MHMYALLLTVWAFRRLWVWDDTFRGAGYLVGRCFVGLGRVTLVSASLVIVKSVSALGSFYPYYLTSSVLELPGLLQMVQSHPTVSKSAG